MVTLRSPISNQIKSNPTKPFQILKKKGKLVRPFTSTEQLFQETVKTIPEFERWLGEAKKVKE